MQQHVKDEAFRVESLMKNMQAKCFDRCVTNIKTSIAPPVAGLIVGDPENKNLTREEAQCIDRCSWKYLQSHKIFTSSIMRAQGKKK